MKNIRWSLLSTASGLLVQLFNLSNSLSIAAFRASLSGMKVFIYEVAKAGRGEILKFFFLVVDTFGMTTPRKKKMLLLSSFSRNVR